MNPSSQPQAAEHTTGDALRDQPTLQLLSAVLYRYRAWGLTAALALILDLTGALHVYGMSGLMGSRLALGAAVVLMLLALGWLVEAAGAGPASATPQASRNAQRVLALLMLLAWLATARDFSVFLAPNGPPLLMLGLAAGAVALLGALIWPPGPIWLVALAAVLGSLGRVVSFAYVPIEPARGDMLPLVEGALGNLLAGRSPYTIYRLPWELPLTYLPLTWLAYLPPFVLGLDIRLTNLLADLGVGAVVVWLSVVRSAPARQLAPAPGALLWAWTFLQPTTLHWSQATTAPVLWVGLALMLALLVSGRQRGVAIALGLCAAASPLAAVVAPFVLLHWLRAGGWRRALAYAGLALVPAALFILPFLIWSPEQFVFGVLRWFNDNTLFPRLRWDMDNTWARMVGFSGIFWRRGLEGLLKPVQVLLLLGLLALYWRRGATAVQLAPVVVAALLLFTVFNPVLWPYLYNPALVAALVAVVALERFERQDPEIAGRQGETGEQSPPNNEPQVANRMSARRRVRRLVSRHAAARTLLVLAVWPLLTAPKPAIENAYTSYEPDIDTLLLEQGYTANIISFNGLRGLRASQLSYTTSVWMRDLDYAISGYAYALGDLSIFRESIELFLFATDQNGVVPETIYLDRLLAENRWSWDSMPNLVHAVYVYVAKTGDRQFYHIHRPTLERIGRWIANLDTNDDGLPDRDIFPFGYYDSVNNGVQHTYALAKFYAAFRELAELERYDGRSGAAWDTRAQRLRAGFHRSVADNGYWPDNQPWPIAWRRADGRIVPLLETFGVFEALRSGLIAPDDGAHYSALIRVLHERLPELIDGPTPMKLTLGGYSPSDRRLIEPPVPLWMLDASAPWVVGLAVPAYLAAGYADDADALLRAYTAMARMTDPPVIEFAAGPGARYGPGSSLDGGRTWDSAAWFQAIYGGHYGLTMTPEALVVRPRLIHALPGDAVRSFSYQGARVALALDAGSGAYRLRVDRRITARLYPPGNAGLLQVDGGPAQPAAALTLVPGHEYVVTAAPEPAVPMSIAASFTAR